MQNCCMNEHFNLVDENLELKQTIEGLEIAIGKLQKENTTLAIKLQELREKRIIAELKYKLASDTIANQAAQIIDLIEETADVATRLYSTEEELERAEEEINRLHSIYAQPIAF